MSLPTAENETAPQTSSPYATCMNCRKSHSKCEWPRHPDSRQGCTRCTKLGENCRRGPAVKFKHCRSRDLLFDPAQPWANCPRKLRYHDETEEVAAFYDVEASQVFSKGSVVPTAGDAVTPPPWEPKQNIALPTQAAPGESGTIVPVNVYPENSRDILTRPPVNSRLCMFNRQNSAKRDIIFPILDNYEETLMRYYLDYMCNWFDLCDSSRHFALEVPRRAMTCPTLLNAIYALCSRHLSKRRPFDEFASDRYHQQCLRELSNISQDSDALMDDDLLAATILLRTLEEIDVPLLGTDFEGHLLGIQLFMNSHGSSQREASSLRQAAFWIGLRQEVTMAFASQRSINISLAHNFIDTSFSPANDDTWANRIILHTARVVEFCFGDGPQGVAEYRALQDYEDGWMRSRPMSFLPVTYPPRNPAKGEIFPRIMYLSHAVVIGVAHATLARALLICYDPTIPKIGPARLTAQEAQEAEVREQICELCGIALANPATVPAMITASLGIASCGDRFNGEEERHALLGVLVRTQVEHSWPTEKAQSSLKAAWGWAT